MLNDAGLLREVDLWQFYYAHADRARGIKRWCSSDVCLSVRPKSREQRGLRRLKLAQR